MKIVQLESLRVSEEKMKELKTPFEQMGHVIEVYERSSAQEQIGQAREADVIIIGNMPLKRDVLSECKNLKMIDVGFTGTDHVDLEYAKEQGITVCNAAGYSTSTVAELVLGEAICLLRHVGKNQEACRGGQAAFPKLGKELNAQTVGIVGFGAIGSKTAELFHLMGARVLAYMPRPKRKPDYVKTVTLKELMEQSDLVSLHCPLNDSTREMIGKEELSWMKPTAVLINAARGAVVDTAALAEALENGAIAGAAIDVYENEPPLDQNHPLLHTPNTLVTPHIAFASEQSMVRRAEIVYENLRAWLEGIPQNVRVEGRW